MDWMTNWIFDLLYGLQKSICYIIDFIREIFYTLSGLQPVNINGEESDLLTHFIMSPVAKRTFLIVMLISFILLAIFVFVAIVRSEYAHGENKKSKSVIWGNAFKSFAIFLLIPFLLIAGITLVNIIMGAVNSAMNPYVLEVGSQSTLGGQILVTSGQFAYIGDSTSRLEIEKMFITGELNYFDLGVVIQYYNLRSLDYLVGLFGSIVIMVMFVMSAVTFIQRIFDIVLLYLVAPVSVSTIPVDDGNRFKIWRDMMISKVLGAYGIILSMNLFFIIVPQISSITFFADTFKNQIVQILFLIGGAFAVTKGNLVISQLTGSTAGNNETQQLIRNIQTGGHITKATIGAGGSLVGRIVGGKKFLNAKKSSGSYMAGISESFIGHSTPSYTNKGNSKLAKFAGAPTRLASMPIGMIKDLTSGGIVEFTKNIKPRMSNVFTGDSIVNHPQISKKELNPIDNPNPPQKE